MKTPGSNVTHDCHYPVAWCLQTAWQYLKTWYRSLLSDPSQFSAHHIRSFRLSVIHRMIRSLRTLLHISRKIPGQNPHFVPTLSNLLSIKHPNPLFIKTNRLRLDDRDFEPHRGKLLLSSPVTSIRAMGPTQSPVGRYGNVKRPGRKVHHSLPSNTKVKNVRSYISTPPIRL